VSRLAVSKLAGSLAWVCKSGERPSAAGAKVDRQDSQALRPVEAAAWADIGGRVGKDDATVELACYLGQRGGFEDGPRGVRGCEGYDEHAAGAVSAGFGERGRQEGKRWKCEDRLPVPPAAVRAEGAPPVGLSERVSRLGRRLGIASEESGNEGVFGSCKQVEGDWGIKVGGLRSDNGSKC
jgi:hypothetical protein